MNTWGFWQQYRKTF